MQRPGRFPGAWSFWISVGHQFAPNIMNVSVHFIHVLLSYLFFLVSQCSGVSSAIGVHGLKGGGKNPGIQQKKNRGGEPVRPLLRQRGREYISRS